ncbi:MAG: phosphotransferase [Pseudonocardiaceae bacterium]
MGAVQYTVNGVQEHFDVELPSEMFADLEWTTAHADLHWGNLRGPQLCILDWESWRPAPAGYDMATLYWNSCGWSARAATSTSPTARFVRKLSRS